MDTRKAKTIRLDSQDWQAIQAIKSEHGITSDTDAIRFALRNVYRDIRTRKHPNAPAPDKERPFHPTP